MTEPRHSTVKVYGFFDLLVRLFSFGDVIWIGLAIASAWRIAQVGRT